MTPPLSVAVVGSGPSGAYCALLLSEHESLDVRVDGVPFDERSGTVPNDAGRVLGGRGPVPGRKLHDRAWLLEAATAGLASRTSGGRTA